MDEVTEVPIVVGKEDPVLRLRKIMRGGKLVKLVELLEGVMDDTGYGDVKIIIAQGTVQNFKVEKSYR